MWELRRLDPALPNLEPSSPPGTIKPVPIGIRHQVAYHSNAPCDLNAVNRDGQVKLRIELKHQVVAAAKLMPTSRMRSGKASALYVKGTGLVPED